MGTGTGAKRFQELIAWQLARELRRALWRLCVNASVAQEFKFRDQLKNAARSTTANIAEGFPCSHIEFARFLEIASRSIREIEDRLIEALDEKLITPEQAETAIRLMKRTTTAVARLMDYLLRTPDPPSYKPARHRRAGARQLRS